MWDKFSREYGGYTGYVWLAIVGALVIRALHSKSGSFWTAVKETITGLFLAYMLTKPTMLIGDLPAGAEIGVAVCWAIWGGKLMVLALEAKSLRELIQAWRGK